MKRLSVATSLAVCGLLLSASLASAARPSTAFSGEWIGNDPPFPDGDGSTVHLFVSGGDRPQIVFIDEFGTVCVNEDASSTVFVALLSGFVDGTTLFARFNVAKCGTTTLTFLRGEGAAYELDDQGNADPSDDTLWDGFVLWTRA